MSELFDLGPVKHPFKTLAGEFPGTETYPQADFRTEWGPIFYRGRLDGSARVLVLGQDPAVHETIVRRILVGVAGKRVQGFLQKLGITQSYVMVNTFLYSVYGQSAGEHHKHDPAIATYRHRWLDALLDKTKVDVVVAFGGLAESAWKQYVNTETGARVAARVRRQALPHPTYPDSAAHGNSATRAKLVKEMLVKWNEGLGALASAIQKPDATPNLKPYGDDFLPEDLPDIPSRDLPPGIPPWMANEDGWGQRVGDSAAVRRATIQVVVPGSYLP